MNVDVVTEIVINRPRSEVAAFASDPDNATAWYHNIERVERLTPVPVTTGSKVAFTASFLGRRLAYTYEVTDLTPGDQLVMRTADGPFPMETSYSWSDTADGQTLMTLRNRGQPTGFANVAAPMMAAAMRRANRADLKRLKTILETEKR